MERQLLIEILKKALSDPFSLHGTVLISMLERCEWYWQIATENGEDVIYSIQNKYRDIVYIRDDDSAGHLWAQFTERMKLEFELYVAKLNRKRSVVGKARLLPFPDKRRPTPAA